jgi:hypothetical protein
MELQEILQNRWRFMRKLYDLTNGNPGRRIRQRKIRRELDWTVADLEPVQDYLHDAGLIELEVSSSSDAFEKFLQWVFPGDTRIRITSTGVDEVEQGQQNPHQPTPHLPPYVTIYGDYAQVQVGTSQSNQVQVHNSTLIAENTALQEFLAEFRRLLPQLDNYNQDLARVQLQTVEVQLASSKPNERILREAVHSLRSIAEGVAGNAAFTALVQLAGIIIGSR